MTEWDSEWVRGWGSERPIGRESASERASKSVSERLRGGRVGGWVVEGVREWVGQ